MDAIRSESVADGEGAGEGEGKGEGEGEGEGEAAWGGAKSILEAKCSGCHTSAGGSGGWTTQAHATTQLPSGVCDAKTKYECMLERIQAGTMPQGKECSGDAIADEANANCLTADEQATVSAWVAGGGAE